MHIGDNKLVVTTGHKTFHFDLPKVVENYLTYVIDSIIIIIIIIIITFIHIMNLVF